MKMRGVILTLTMALLSVSSTPAKFWSVRDKLDNAIARTQAASSRPTSLSSEKQTVAPNKLALLVGINNYKYPDRVPALAGSLNDVEDMREVLIGKFEFPPENIMVLTDSKATHTEIINAIRTHLIAKARPGDIVVVHYSGHGSQMKDVTGKMISGLDETIVPYDSRDPQGKIFDISGAELHGLLLQLAAKTKNVTFILDSCHSGTLVRGARVRSIPADTRTPPPNTYGSQNTTRGVVDTDEHASPAFATIAAATSKESAFEVFEGEKDHGALTYFLTRQLRRAKAGTTYRDIMDNVSADVTATFPGQHPSLEGTEADQYVFGDGNSLARSYVVASPSALEAHHVTLGAGQVQGATVGSRYDVYPPGSKAFASPAKPLATVQILSVSAFTSQATVVSGDKVPTASRAVERYHQYGNLRMRVFLDGVEDSPTLMSINDELQGARNIEVVSKPSTCHMQVRQSGKNIQTLAADSTSLSPPVPVDDPNVVQQVVGQIKSWAKWFNVLSVHNPHPEIELEFTLKESETRDPMARVGRPDMGVLDGETVQAALVNRADRDLYVAVLDLTSDGRIAVVYPTEKGVKEVLRRTTSLSIPLKASVPKGRSVVTDILKVFAGYDPIDLSPLTQAAIRSPLQESNEPGTVEALLMDSTGEMQRGVTPLLNKSVDLGDWTTVQRVLVVRRR
jgi:hypothetical protein